jgi:predicted membrane channel-forming protein YqfA (hemolysin III family)
MQSVSHYLVTYSAVKYSVQYPWFSNATPTCEPVSIVGTYVPYCAVTVHAYFECFVSFISIKCYIATVPIVYNVTLAPKPI